LRLEVKVLGWRSNFAKMEGRAYVGDQLVAEAVLSCALVPRQDKKKD
jgi:3-hydroxymyristoyl/3-hydroxydecanoyl-(acyl carrier protein) dehydratase